MTTRDELRGKRFSVLDKGWVALIDCMGDDHDIVDAARISYGKGTRSVSDDRTLIRYLMRHRHGTPFEMPVLRFAVRMPMDVMRQWVRHRTASMNEYSTRYSEAIDDMHATAPDAWRMQSGSNKQGSSGFIAERDPDLYMDGRSLTAQETFLHSVARSVYQKRLTDGVAREQARKDLPLSTYTEAYWQMNLRNLLDSFLVQRMDAHAQHEIRQYANVIGREIVAKLFPLTWEAFEDYRLDSMTLSRLDIEAIHKATRTGNDAAILSHFTNQRERDECQAKLDRLGLRY